MSDKYALGPAARALKAKIDAGGYEPSAEMYDDPTLLENADVMMGAIRPEMYEIGAVIGSDITIKMYDRMREMFPPYGLICADKERMLVGGEWTYVPKPLTQVANYKELDGAFSRSSLYFITTPELYRLPKHLSSPHKRLEFLVQRAHEAYPTLESYESTAKFLWSGYNTAVSMTIGAYAGINSLYKSSVDMPERARFMSLAARSMCLVSPIGADNIDRINAYRRAIEAQTVVDSQEGVPVINPNLLMFVPDLESEAAYVDYVKPPKKLIDPRTSRQVGAIAVSNPTLTCLGTVKFPGVEIASRVVWNWVLEPFADLRYPQ